jgi:hypothetical protein
VIVIAVATALLVVSQGAAVRNWGEQMDPGIGRDVVLAFGKPTGWVADRLPFADATDDLTDWIASGDDLGQAGSFDAPTETSPAERGAVPPVSPDSFDPLTLGEERPRLELDKLLVTGDSLAMPIDVELARRLSEQDVEVVRDPHVGTGISKSGLVDWGRLSTQQVENEQPDAVVAFIGANEGFPLPTAGGEVECCGPEWAAPFADRVRRMMNTYRRDGAARVYWLTIPTPRDGDLAEITRTVNAAIEVAAVPWLAHVRVVDLGAVFTPDDRFESALDGELVREADGLHLTPRGAEIAADVVLETIRRDFPAQ